MVRKRSHRGPSVSSVGGRYVVLVYIYIYIKGKEKERKKGKEPASSFVTRVWGEVIAHFDTVAIKFSQ
jgi:hypothetical protein